MIVGMAFQKNPDPILWCVLDTGTLISMTYDRQHEVVAWARHPLPPAGEVVSPPVCIDCTWPTPE